MNTDEVTALSRHLRSQGYTTRTVKRAHDARAVTAATRREGDMIRVALYPSTDGVYCLKAMNQAFHSLLGELVPVVVDHRHLSGSFADPEHVVETLL